MPEKISYEVDPFNRLVISAGNGRLRRHRRVVDGVFRISPDNTLSYHAKAPLDDTAEAPRRLCLAGSWSLTKDRDLKLTLDAERPAAEASALTLKGEIIGAAGDRLLFALTTKRADGSGTTYVLELRGTWFADRNNRLSFAVTRTASKPDIFVFAASWAVNKDNELCYRFERTSRRKGVRRAHEIVFKGRWQITESSALTYRLEGSSNSAFTFRIGAAACTDSGMEFEIGAGARRTLRPAMKRLVLFGRWKPSGKATLNFEIEAADGRLYSIEFGAECRIGKDNTVTLMLRNPAGTRSLGLELELTRKIVRGNGEAFLRLIRARDESAVLAGAAFRW